MDLFPCREQAAPGFIKQNCCAFGQKQAIFLTRLVHLLFQPCPRIISLDFLAGRQVFQGRGWV